MRIECKIYNTLTVVCRIWDRTNNSLKFNLIIRILAKFDNKKVNHESLLNHINISDAF